MHNYNPLLNVYLIWHPDAQSLCSPLATHIYQNLNRHPNKPMAPGIGIPTYFRSQNHTNQTTPKPINLDNAQHTIIFPLIEGHLVFDNHWANYLADLYTQSQQSNGQHQLIPIALTGSAFNLHPKIASANFIRLFNQTAEALPAQLLHYISHVLARFLENRPTHSPSNHALSPCAIKLFISHTKREPLALELAKALKQAIDNTQLGRFFDTVDIAAGDNFPHAITANIKDSALIAIRSDRYVDSPWCRLEVITAKKHHRPMIIVDALQHQENRSFPYLSNVPSIRYDLNASLTTVETQSKFQTIINYALLEVLRFYYTKRHFEHLQSVNYLPADADLYSRPPEEADLKHQADKISIYPDPPLGVEEIKELRKVDRHVYTPTTLKGSAMKQQCIGISISEPDPGELSRLGLSDSHLQNAMLEIARYCLAQGAELIYGGDLRPNGFTENLLELVRYHNDATEQQYTPVQNYLAWPLHAGLNIAWAATNKDALHIEKVPAPADVMQAGYSKDMSPSDIPGYIWGRCLTAMREEIVDKTTARIMLGGKTLGYKGKYPGLVEEAWLCLQAKKPLYLLGGYGGATQVIIQAIQGHNPQQLTLEYQEQSAEYKVMLTEYAQHRQQYAQHLETIDYVALSKSFAEFGIAGLNNGLSVEENLCLFTTTNHEQAIGLILSGLANAKIAN